MQIAAATTLSAISWQTTGEYVQGVLSVGILAVFLSAPIAFGYILYKNVEDLAYRAIEKKFGSMYQGIWIQEDSIYALSYIVVFQIRRTAFVGVMVFLDKTPSIQLFFFIQLSVLYMIYLNWHRIYNEPFQLTFEVVNECGMMLICYHLLLFTNLVHDPYLLSRIGKSLIIIVAIIFGCCIVTIFFITLREQYRKLKRQWRKKKYEALLNERLARKAEAADQIDALKGDIEPKLKFGSKKPKRKLK